MRWSEVAFNGPVAGITPPIQRTQCPGEGCGQWIASEHGLWGSHWKTNACKCVNRTSSAKPESTLVRRWTRQPFGRGHHWVLPVTGPLKPPDFFGLLQNPNLPRARPYTALSDTAAFCPAWLKWIGWAEWRDMQLERGLTVEQLISFKDLPPILLK